MNDSILGLHHITAIAGDVQNNVDFYVGILGLRLVKRTVNFDDPGTYHLYYGDDVGSPGTILTFFPWASGRPGRRGAGQATEISFSIPRSSLDFWTNRLRKHGISFTGPERRFDEEVLRFRDPDGIGLELVAHGGADTRSGWTQGPVPVEHAIRGFYGVTMSEQQHEWTARLLTEVMGFRRVVQEGQRDRFEVGDGGAGTYVDVVSDETASRGFVSVGSIHHVAWRVADEEQLRAWQAKLTKVGVPVTEVKDRNYFLSVYFREPGGVLFEFATDPPGFAVDERPEELGTHLMLPSWLEPYREQLESTLPDIRVPDFPKEDGHDG